MRRHTRIILFMLLVMLLALTGCEKIYTGNTDTQTSSDSEELTETVQETETNPETVRESVESDKVTEGSTQTKKVFESSLGYSVIYDDTVFEYNRTGDYDEIGLRGQTFQQFCTADNYRSQGLQRSLPADNGRSGWRQEP